MQLLAQPPAGGGSAREGTLESLSRRYIGLLFHAVHIACQSINCGVPCYCCCWVDGGGAGGELY